MTGLQALPRLCASGAPVMVMSNQYGFDAEKDALLIGAADVIKKPLVAKSLSELIRHELDSAALTRRSPKDSGGTAPVLREQ